MAGTDEREKKAGGDLVEGEPGRDYFETVDLAAAAGWNLGAAVRTLADGVDRIAGLLGPLGKAIPKKKAPPEPIEPLLDQLGQKVSEHAKKKSYAALADDDAFWDVLRRLMRQHRRRPRALAAPADAPAPAKSKKAKAKPEPEPVEPEEFDDPLAGVLEEGEEEAEAEDKGKKKDKKD